MRVARRPRQKMYYSNVNGKRPIYETDREGNIIYQIIGGEKIPKKTGENADSYAEPTEFFNTISGELTEDEMKAFGGEKIGNAKMTYYNGEYPFKTGTIIWKNTPVAHRQDGSVDEDSADYYVIGVLNAGKHFWKCILTEMVKNEEN